MELKLADILRQLDELKKLFEEEMTKSSNGNDIESIRIQYLGRKSRLTSYFSLMGKVSPEEKPELGQKLNQLKNYFHVKIQEKSDTYQTTPKSKEFFDASLPGIMSYSGRKHPLNIVLDEIKDIFKGMGFSIETGPELETDYYNFEALNIPHNHPSRDLQDTFYITENLLLRTHTSPVQVHTMEKMKPPIRIIAPGRCFRKDAIDASHYPTFHQVEGLCVDEGVTFADLKGVIAAFAKKLFGSSVKIRFRPGYFPFTEPSAEYDISCTNCGGKGCNVCKGTGWLEISGAGMVNPAVFKFVDIDAEKYTGYAFGMGVERITMLKFHIDDIRILYENDIRFLYQF